MRTFFLSPSLHSVKVAALVVFTAILLSGCGGGSGSTGISATNSVSADTSHDAPISTPSPDAPAAVSPTEVPDGDNITKEATTAQLAALAGSSISMRYSRKGSTVLEVPVVFLDSELWPVGWVMKLQTPVIMARGDSGSQLSMVTATGERVVIGGVGYKAKFEHHIIYATPIDRVVTSQTRSHSRTFGNGTDEIPDYAEPLDAVRVTGTNPFRPSAASAPDEPEAVNAPDSLGPIAPMAGRPIVVAYAIGLYNYYTHGTQTLVNSRGILGFAHGLTLPSDVGNWVGLPVTNGWADGLTYDETNGDYHKRAFPLDDLIGKLADNTDNAIRTERGGLPAATVIHCYDNLAGTGKPQWQVVANSYASYQQVRRDAILKAFDLNRGGIGGGSGQYDLTVTIDDQSWHFADSMSKDWDLAYAMRDAIDELIQTLPSNDQSTVTVDVRSEFSPITSPSPSPTGTPYPTPSPSPSGTGTPSPSPTP